MKKAIGSAASLAALLWVSIASAGPADDSQRISKQSGPKRSGLVERTDSRLVQLDVSVRGPRDQVTTLTAEDFELFLGAKPIDDFLVDSLCTLEPEADAAEDSSNPPPRTAAPPKAGTTYLIYFDQAFLTVEGRVRSLQMAEELIERLVGDGDRVSIVSSGQVLETFAEISQDPQELRDALTAIENDPKQWFPAFGTEEERLDDVAQALADPQQGGVEVALQMARQYQAEEAWVTDKALSRMSMVLGRFADQAPPKVTVYFADRMRARAGSQYISFFGASMRDNTTFANMETRAMRSEMAFDRVVREANAHGMRLYTVQPEGLVGPTMASGLAGGTTRHIRSDQDSLKGMALETGGRAFLNGLRTNKIASAIEQDLSCLYLISLRSDQVPQDRQLPVLLRVKRPKVEAWVRGQLYVQSQRERQVSRLMAAFAASELAVGTRRARGTLIPAGYADGEYTALLQVVVDGSPIPSTVWDLGASVLSKGRVREDVSGRVSVRTPGAQVVLESEINLKPGPFEISLVAHDTTSDQILTGKISGDWPKLRGASHVIGPISVLQPAQAAFVRGESVRGGGALGFREEDLLATEKETAVVSLVCRGSMAGKQPFEVERRLVGDTAASFEPLEVAFDETGCSQIRDLIPSGAMTDGSFEYEVRLLQGDQELAQERRSFSIIAGGKPPAPAGETPNTASIEAGSGEAR